MSGAWPVSTAFASVSLLTWELVCQKDELVTSVSELIGGGGASIPRLTLAPLFWPQRDKL